MFDIFIAIKSIKSINLSIYQSIYLSIYLSIIKMQEIDIYIYLQSILEIKMQTFECTEEKKTSLLPSQKRGSKVKISQTHFFVNSD